MKKLIFAVLCGVMMFVPKSSLAVAPSATASLSKNKVNVVVNFSNIKGLKSYSYELTYMGSGREQGVYGSVKTPKANKDSRTLYLGTCSKKVCVAHKNVKNLQVLVTFRSTDGKKTEKLLKISSSK